MNARQQAAIDAMNALEADDFAPVLDAVACRAYESGAELSAQWQSRGPEIVWNRIGRALTAAARKVTP
jgi:hypothetical protein